jgi:hypothetical protein
MVIGTLLWEIMNTLFTCSHARAHAVEGKTFCPDCGRGVIFRWVVLRCVGCGQRRPAGYLFRNVVPSETCCTFCGDIRIERQVLEEPEFFQLRYALLSFETDAEEPSIWCQVSACLKELVNLTWEELTRPSQHHPPCLPNYALPN